MNIVNGSCCLSFTVNGGDGSSGTSSLAGVGGAGGPGGFRGGDAASFGINGAAIGGTGLPGRRGRRNRHALHHWGRRTFLGPPELLPLLGGSGGGGGLIYQHSFELFGRRRRRRRGRTSDRGERYADDHQLPGVCRRRRRRGIRERFVCLIRRRRRGRRHPADCQSLLPGGTNGIFARGGGGGNGGTVGRIRLESIDASAQTAFSTTPPALRIVGPTPIANPISPTVAITSVNGNAVPAVPVGGFGAIDIVLPAPGATTLAISTSGIPGGTTVEVTVKPRIGGAALAQTVPLGGCSVAGVCSSAATFNLAAGAYVAEARATFQIQ